jgi:hypothetical protein
MVGVPELLVMLAFGVMALVVIWPAGRIASRLGFSPLLGILVVVPLANVVLLWFVALADWPAVKR